MQFLYFTVHRHLGKLSSTASMVLLLILSSLVVVIKVISSGIPAALTQLQPPSRLLLLRGRGRKGLCGLPKNVSVSWASVSSSIPLTWQFHISGGFAWLCNTQQDDLPPLHPPPSWLWEFSHLFPPQIPPDGVTLEYNPYSWNLVSLPLWVLGGCLSSWMGKGTAPLNPFPLPL